MSERERLPDRRVGVTFTFDHAYPGAFPMTFTATTGHYPSLDETRLGRIGEVFLSLVNDTDKRVNVDMHDASVILSFALQHGADLEEIGKACLRGEDGVPHGWVGAFIDAFVGAFGGPEQPPSGSLPPVEGTGVFDRDKTTDEHIDDMRRLA